jgi:meiotically up-regulated gene 157 (Mug157) protein
MIFAFEIQVTGNFFIACWVSGGNRTLQGTYSTENLTKFSREWFQWSTGRPIA